MISLILFTPILLFIGVVIKLESKGPIIHWSKRIGRNNLFFKMPKFRTMYIDTPQVATHLLQDSNSHITKSGKILRKTSLDELPQLWSILIGKMSLVGPRPALYNQDDLMEMRTKVNVHTLAPGLTGLAQIRGRDEIPLDLKVKFDEEYLIKKSFFLDFKIIVLTFLKVVNSKGISH